MSTNGSYHSFEDGHEIPYEPMFIPQPTTVPGSSLMRAIEPFRLKGLRKVKLGNRKALPTSSISYIKHPTHANVLAFREGRSNLSLPPPLPKIASDRIPETLVMRSKYLLPPENTTLDGWLSRQETYIDRLRKRDIDILESYTVHGDRMVNNYCRGRLGPLDDLWAAILLRTELPIPLAYSIIDQASELNKKVPSPTFRSLLVKIDAVYDDEEVADMNAVNLFIRENLEFFVNPRNILTLLEQYKQDLIRIITGAPRLTSPLTVYRGIQTESHLSGSIFTNRDFLSTSVHPPSAVEFTESVPNALSRKQFRGGLYELTVSPKVPCLYMEFVTNFGDEYEVLIPPGMLVELEPAVRIKAMPSGTALTMTPHLESTQVVVVHGTVSLQVKDKRKGKSNVRLMDPGNYNYTIRTRTRTRRSKRKSSPTKKVGKRTTKKTLRTHRTAK